MPHSPNALFLDTDIGTDIDDAYALLLAAASPEIQLVGVSTVNNDTVLRAQIASALLNLLARADIPVIAGLGRAMTPGVSLGWMGHEGEGIDLAGIDEPQAATPPDLFAARIRDFFGRQNHPTLVTIGALTNAAALVESLPREQWSTIGRIVSMASTFEGYGFANAAREHNVACDPAAFDVVLRSGIPLTLVGLNVTRRTSMTASQVAKLEAIGGPLAEALTSMHRIWFRAIGRDSSPMHDALAVAMLFRPELITTIPVTAELSGNDGAVIYNSPADGQVTHIEIATDVDVDAFQSLFWERILNAVRANKEMS